MRTGGTRTQVARAIVPVSLTRTLFTSHCKREAGACDPRQRRDRKGSLESGWAATAPLEAVKKSAHGKLKQRFSLPTPACGRIFSQLLTVAALPGIQWYDAGESMIIGVDIGGTKVAAGLVDSTGEITHKTRVPMTPAGDAATGFAG